MKTVEEVLDFLNSQIKYVKKENDHILQTIATESNEDFLIVLRARLHDVKLHLNILQSLKNSIQS